MAAPVYNVKLHQQPDIASAVVATVGNAGEMLYTCAEKNGFVAVETSIGGWVKRALVTHSGKCLDRSDHG